MLEMERIRRQEEDRLSYYRQYRSVDNNYENIRNPYRNWLAGMYFRQSAIPYVFSRDHIEGVNMVSNGMSEDEVDMHGRQRFQRVAVVRREPITVDLVADLIGKRTIP